MKSFLLRELLLTLCLGAFSCSVADHNAGKQSDKKHASVKVVEGEKVRSSDRISRSLVSLVSDDGSNRSYYGSAVVVGRRCLVTAAHNVFPTFQPTALDSLSGPLVGFKIQPQDVIIHPDFKVTVDRYFKEGFFNIPFTGNEHFADIALIRLDADLPPERIQPLPIASVADAELIRTRPDIQWNVAGFGWTHEPNQDFRGIPSYEPHLAKVTPHPVLRSLFAATEMVIQPVQNNQGVCNGDSGGPLYMEAPGLEQKLLGVLSRSPATKCAGEHAIYTDVTRHLDWMLMQAGCVTP